MSTEDTLRITITRNIAGDLTVDLLVLNEDGDLISESTHYPDVLHLHDYRPRPRRCWWQRRRAT